MAKSDRDKRRMKLKKIREAVVLIEECVLKFRTPAASNKELRALHYLARQAKEGK